MAKHYTYLVTYDISDPKALKRVASYLEKKGKRLQKSVFVLNLPQHQIRNVQAKLPELAGETAHVMLLPLCRSCLNKAEFLGEADEPFVMV